MNRLLVVIVAAVALSSTALAQRGPRARERIYDPATEETVSGEVRDVVSTAGRLGVHLQLGTAAGPVQVHLGPAWYLDQAALSVAQGDRLEITGSRVTLDGAAVVVARVVQKGGVVHTLRDPAGVPAWAGARRR